MDQKALADSGYPMAAPAPKVRVSRPPTYSASSTGCLGAPSAKPLPRQLGAAAKRRKLGEGHVPAHRRHAAIGAGHDLLLGDVFHRLADDGSHILRRLDHVARDIDRANEDVLAVEQLEQMHWHARVTAFDRDLVDPALRQCWKDR